MYYLPYMDYSVDLPTCVTYYRDGYIQKLKTNHSWLAYKLWVYRQPFKLMKMDLKYTKGHEDLLIENNMWGKDHLDLELWTTYYGPLQDYTIQYYSRAYSIGNI